MQNASAIIIQNAFRKTTTCAICYNLVVKNNSCHNFHKECINNWLIQNKNCPVCRSTYIIPEILNLRRNKVELLINNFNIIYNLNFEFIEQIKILSKSIVNVNNIVKYWITTFNKFLKILTIVRHSYNCINLNCYNFIDKISIRIIKLSYITIPNFYNEFYVINNLTIPILNNHEWTYLNMTLSDLDNSEKKYIKYFQAAYLCINSKKQGSRLREVLYTNNFNSNTYDNTENHNLYNEEDNNHNFYN